MKKKDPVKSYIDRNREELDDLRPPDLWKGIEERLPEEKKERKMVPLSRVWQVAAGVAVLIGAAWIFTLTGNGDDPKIASTETEAERPAVVQKDYAELEEAGIYYRTKIEEAGEELKSYHLEDEDLESMQLLEDELIDLRKTLGNEPDDEKVVEAMIQIYRYKLDLMKDLLNELKNEPHEGEEDNIVVVPM